MRGPGDDVRRMILLLETAAVLDSRADRAPDPAQAATLRRRAGQRLREAQALRDCLVADGVRLPPAPREQPAAPELVRTGRVR